MHPSVAQSPRGDVTPPLTEAPSANADSRIKTAFNAFWTIIIPSSSKAFQDQRQENINKGKLKCKPFQDELIILRAVSRHYSCQRREASQNLAECIDPESLAVPDPGKLESLMSIHREKVAIGMHVEGQILKLETIMDKITEEAATESCLRITGYKGIRDWASDTLEAYSDLVQAISTVCFVGAGLTYTSIFSATRGDLGLMSWAFSLFIVGIIITVTIQSFLRQCSRLEDYPFSTQRLWEVILFVFIYSSCLTVIAAICLLLLTVLKLHFTSTLGNPGDAPLTSEVSSRPAAILALSAIGIGMFLGLVVLGLFVLANGVNALFWRRRTLRNRENEKRKTRGVDELA